MKIKHLLSILTIFLISFIATIYAQNHTVKKGETVYAIANKYGISVQDINTLNPSAIGGIKEGQNLKISATATGFYRNYIVKAKDTLYSLSKANNISIQELLDANPNLEKTGLQEGQAIRLPSKPIEHKVEKKETLYNIARRYGVSEQSIRDANPDLQKGLKKGMKILVPPASQAKEEKLAVIQPKSEGFSKSDTKTLRIGVFLPFTNESDAHKVRYIEYYKGFLIAVQELKAQGYSMEVYAFDVDEAAKMNALLESDDIKDLHLIIGGVSDEEISILANYTKRNNIKYVIPFPFKDQIKLGDNCFVLSRSNQALEEKVVDYYANQFGGQHTIIIKDSQNNKEHFVASLENSLKGKSGRVTSLNYNLTLEDELSLILSNKNVFVPASSSQATLSKMLTIMKILRTKYPEKDLKIFGYPDWQTFSQHESDMKSFGATIYSSFFLDESTYKAKNFTTKFEKWYGSPMMRMFPRYGVLGYDTGIYFLTVLSKYGFDFEKKIQNADIETLQTAIQFVQSKTGGHYINDGLFMVEYTDGGINKEKYSK